MSTHVAKAESVLQYVPADSTVPERLMPCHRLVRWLQTHSDCPYSLALTAVIACSMAVGLPGTDATSVSTTTIVSISAISLGQAVTCLYARALPAYADPRGAEPWLTP